MDEQLIERAVEAAAKANFDRYTDHPHGDAWEETPEQVKAIWRGGVTEPVTAALAEVEGSLTAERDELRRWKEEALPVLSGLQNLGRALDVPLGERITGNVAAKRAEELAASVARVEALHVEHRQPCSCLSRRVNGKCFAKGLCHACRYEWPCPTIKALRGESE